MSRGENTHWCHQCRQHVRLQAPKFVCPYCDGRELPEVIDAHSAYGTGFRLVNANHIYNHRFSTVDSRLIFNGQSPVDFFFGRGVEFGERGLPELIEQNDLILQLKISKMHLNADEHCPVCKDKADAL